MDITQAFELFLSGGQREVPQSNKVTILGTSEANKPQTAGQEAVNDNVPELDEVNMDEAEAELALDEESRYVPVIYES